MAKLKDKKPVQISKCYFCDNQSKYLQPDKDTGNIIDVCEKHFTLRYMA